MMRNRVNFASQTCTFFAYALRNEKVLLSHRIVRWVCCRIYKYVIHTEAEAKPYVCIYFALDILFTSVGTWLIVASYGFFFVYTNFVSMKFIEQLLSISHL